SINQLKELRALMNKENQKFRDLIKQDLEDMKILNHELYGQSSLPGNVNASERQKTFKDLFNNDNTCLNIFKNSGINILSAQRNGGLLGMQTQMEDPRLEADTYRAKRSKGTYEKDLLKQIQRIKDDINETGLDVWMGSIQQDPNYINGSSVPGLTNFAGISTALKTNLRTYQNKVRKQLQQVRKADPSFSVPPLDENFSSDIDNFIAGAQEHYKNKYVEGCVTGNEYGLGLSSKDVLDSLRDTKNRKGKSATLNDYRRSVDYILTHKNMTVDEKMRELAALESGGLGNGQIKMKYRDPKTQKDQYQTAYGYFQQIVKDCEQNYALDNSHAPGKGGAGAVSRSTEIQRAVKALRNLKEEVNSFSEDLGNAIFAQVTECKNIDYSADSCSASNLTPSSPNFCFSHSDQCAKEINSCHQTVEAKVKERTQKLEKVANTYNAKVEQFVANQDAILQQVRAVTAAQADHLSKFFESVPFLNTEDMFIPLPDLADSAFNVRLRAGSPDAIQKLIGELDQKLAKLEGSLANQGGKLDQKLDQYMQTIANQMEENQARWNETASRCSEAEQAYRQQIAEQNAQGQAREAETQGKVGAFCKKYDRLAQTSPGPGCDGDNSPSSLYGEASEIAAHIDHSVFDQLGEYERVCHSYNNELKSDDETSDEDDKLEKAPLLSYCSGSGSFESRITSKLKKRLKRALPSGYSQLWGELEDYIDGEEDTLASDLRDTSFGEMASHIRDLQENHGDSRDVASDENFCSEFRDAYKEREETLEKGIKLIEVADEETGKLNGKTKEARMTDEEKEKAMDKLYSSLKGLDSKYRRVNDSLLEISSISIGPEASELKWRQVGQRYAGTCRAAYSGARGAINSFTQSLGGNNYGPNIYGGNSVLRN
ncbi:MAG: hypothetical protein ACPGJV_15930, partial [Bacteriovoracaceae bacterium]